MLWRIAISGAWSRPARQSRRHAIEHRLFDLLGAQFERRHVLAQRRDVVLRGIRPRLDVAAHGAHGWTTVVAPGPHRRFDRREMVLRQHNALRRSEPGAEQQHIDVDPMRVLQREAFVRDARRGINR